jgi:2-polyprenyl-3-methyl-5-hydroxy-6-metoxy-1,4-benzoquinol methylase
MTVSTLDHSTTQPATSRACAKTYPKRQFVSSPLETFNADGSRFDAVYCSEVIEHVINPRRFLTALAGVMRDGPILMLTTPHIREYRRRGYLKMQEPDHKVYFSNATMRRLLRECGFERIRFHFNPFKGIILAAFKANHGAD